MARAARAAGSATGRPFTDLAGFLSYLDASCSVIATEAQLEEAAFGVARRARSAGVRYVDLIANPTHWPQWSRRLDRFIGALDRGFRSADAAGLPPVGLCVSLKRDQSSEEALALVDRLIELRHPRVVGLSIDGNEAATGPTGPRFAPAFARARAAGLRCCAHAGESSGPEGVRDAIDHLGVERIDHGVRAIEDPDLVLLLAARGIPLDVCPTSNVALGVVGSLRTHPVEELRRAGVRVSLNTDDPVLFATTVDREYEQCARAFAWSTADLAAVARTSIEASFAERALQQDLLADLDAFLATTG